jgi:serine/threonine protein kinase
MEVTSPAQCLCSNTEQLNFTDNAVNVQYTACLDPANLLGKGASSMVFKGTIKINGSARDIAIKVYDFPVRPKSDLKRRLYNKEINVMKLLSQKLPSYARPYIVNFYGQYQITDNRSVVCLELLSRKTLESILTPGLDSSFVIDILHQIATAMTGCHQIGVTHGDLKPDNIAYDETQKKIVLMDFNMGACDTRKLDISLGTPLYMAPEVLLCPYTQEPYSPHTADIWSFGQIAFALMTGANMFDKCANLSQLISRIKRPIVPSSVLKNKCRSETIDTYSSVLRGLLLKNPEERQSFCMTKRLLESLMF